MESNGMTSGMYSSMQQGMLGLEMSLHHSLPQPNPQNLPPQHQPMVSFGHHEGDNYLTQADNQPSSSSLKQGYPFPGKSKNQNLNLSDDDEPGFTPENSTEDAKKKMSPWQRMKWTDNMVRLLIMVVFYIGDEVGSDGNDPIINNNKKKGGGVLQKKGKWKSVSRAMMERGFYVSPQQCEDKFNDLNKRYKRVNDILGKGTACRVVENQSLLDTMDHLSPKMKEEVKKLLNSKHLFFREMCAYHNSCGHGTNVGGGGGGPEIPPEPAPVQVNPQQQRCLHSTENAPPVMPNLSRGENEGSKLAKGMSFEDDGDDDEDDDEDDDDEDEDDDEVIGGGSKVNHHQSHHDDDMNSMDERSSKKRSRKSPFHTPLIQQLDSELLTLVQDGTKNPFEKRQWLKAKLMRLEEQRVGIQSQAFELEKERLKWLKYSTKKEREMEREKLSHEHSKLENERMVLLIRQRELDLIDHHQHQHHHSSNKKTDPSSITG